MLQPYHTILEPGQAEFTLSHSRFIGYAAPVCSQTQAQAFIESLRKKHWDANHNVWAYVLSNLGGGQEVSQRYSDDGEPQGTAGIPTLEVIRKANLVDLVLVVTRYFGGIKLGAGGLVRAYTQGAKIGLAAAGIIHRIPYLTCFIQTQYPLVGKFQREFEQRGYPIKNVDYTDKVTFQILAPFAEETQLYALVNELSAGQSLCRKGDPVYVDFKDGVMLK